MINPITGRPSLMDMIEEYRVTLKSNQHTMEPVVQAAPVAQPVTYGNTVTHPGQPVGNDDVPLWGQAGEFVVNKEATDMFLPQIEAMNDQGRMVQEQPQAFAEGGVVLDPTLGQQFNQYATSNAGSALGERLALIGAGDLTGAAGVTAQSVAGSLAQSKAGTKDLIDPQDGSKYYTRSDGLGGKTYISYATQEVVTDTSVINRLNQLGTEGAGTGKVGDEPDKLFSKYVTDRMGSIAREGRAAIDEGAGYVIDVIKSASTSIDHFVKIGAMAAAASDEAVFTELSALVDDNYVMSQIRPHINAYYRLMLTQSKIEVLASQASGEQRLTDEDAKRYLNAMFPKDATPETMLVALGEMNYDARVESARTSTWYKFVAEHPKRNELNEHFFNKTVWTALADKFIAEKQMLVNKFVSKSTYKPNKVATNAGAPTVTSQEVYDALPIGSEFKKPGSNVIYIKA